VNLVPFQKCPLDQEKISRTTKGKKILTLILNAKNILLDIVIGFHGESL